MHKQLARLALCSLVLQVKDLGSRAGGFMVKEVRLLRTKAHFQLTAALRLSCKKFRFLAAGCPFDSQTLIAKSLRSDAELSPESAKRIPQTLSP